MDTKNMGAGNGIYLDNNATTMIDPKVVEAMMPYFTTYYGNPSSQHGFGVPVEKAIERAREQVADLIGAEHPDEIIFTSCASESDNAALWTSLWTQKNKDEIVTTKLEHPAIIDTCSFLEARGVKVKYLSADSKGDLNADEFASLLTDKTALASIMWANNETGNIYDIPTLSQIAAERGIVFHSDAVQAVGKIPVDVKNTAVRMLSFSGHKLHAPKGIGALYVRRGTRFLPYLHGGHQERGRRAGTENVPYIVGLGVACELAKAHLNELDTRVRALRDKLEQGIVATVPEVIVMGDSTHRTPNTVNIGFKFVEGEAILLMLNEYGIAASSGSACSSESLEPSHVMQAMGIPFSAAHGTIRFSLSRFTTEAEIDKTLEVLPGIIERLRQMSPYWNLNKPKVKNIDHEFDPDSQERRA
ncbi:MAG: cysteine desulfurase NifS [Anaerobiospirillum succiniciproducens]|uniref:cysteine desulfurase NifS n=1 Tax=Anaerobiospirillum succiniciproducens TaxID=13335 RepID=UPI002355215C|nr:cysteine desulfurase NifS [Anaerobiospirillum succiniciproducens]MCI6862654.1 cysteine desulfurase NifS [Anaerobiospirillum succiniciproducens]MDO4676017.1 cysteine desulfurase NifS [Anaerobiospirillum succiniciproducens]MDY2799296.1 cysteine desulfurase NifS [Anaerobiospirillum succiniciproducens]